MKTANNQIIKNLQKFNKKATLYYELTKCFNLKFKHVFCMAEISRSFTKSRFKQLWLGFELALLKN